MTITFYGIYNGYAEKWWTGADLVSPQQWCTKAKAEATAAKHRIRYHLDEHESEVRLLPVKGETTNAVNKEYRARKDVPESVIELAIQQAKRIRSIAGYSDDYRELLDKLIADIKQKESL